MRLYYYHYIIIIIIIIIILTQWFVGSVFVFVFEDDKEKGFCTSLSHHNCPAKWSLNCAIVV